MGFDWPASPLLFFGVIILLGVALWAQGRALLKSTLPSLAWKLVGLRGVAVILLILLIARPFIETEAPDTARMSLLTLSDLSGSMDARDNPNGERRIAQVRSLMSVKRTDSWVNKMSSKYGKVQSFGFSDSIRRLHRNSWSETEMGRKTALGDALQKSLSLAGSEVELGSVVVFSDGLNNQGKPILEVAKEYRSRGIPINVVGVGERLVRGDIRVSFANRKPNAVAKEELLLAAIVENQFESEISTELELSTGGEVIQTIPISLARGEKKSISFSPILTNYPGPKRFQLSIEAPNGDADPSNDEDSLLVVVNDPERFAVLYLSNCLRPLYSFLKRSIGNEERFDLNSIIRLGDNSFHALGEKVKPSYPTEPNFWMQFDAIILDLDCLSDLNATMHDSLRDFVQKRGGGLLTFGALDNARSVLGGVLPVVEVDKVLAKDNLSLRVLEEPLFSPKDKVEKMKPFIPDRLPGYFVSKKNKGARGVVVSRASGKPVLCVQAYGAGKAAYWGVPDDWRRALQDEKGNKDFRKFWLALTQWLAEGGEERLKLEESNELLPRGMDAKLTVEALGSDFEPATDAMVKAEIFGPDGFTQEVQLYPQGAMAGQYSGSFKPKFPGAYQVNYMLKFPDGEELSAESFLRVSESGQESQDLSFNERDLKMLAKLTGGEYLPVASMDDSWNPKFASSVPTLKKRNSLAEAWPIFVVIFLAAGVEWILRRQAGLK